MSTGVIAGQPAEVKTQGIRQVVLAAALGTVFEWYDFFIYGSLAVFFGGLFFPKGNESAAILASLATFGAGFWPCPKSVCEFRFGMETSFIVLFRPSGPP